VAPGMSGTGSTGMTQTSATIHDCSGSGCAPVNTTTYFHGDQIGSARLLSAGYGYPVWQGTFTPFGQEVSPELTSNHYKFNGKERGEASEGGLDNFGARSYSSVIGRWMTPDWSDEPSPVPYAKLTDPQSLNLYSFVTDDPLSHTDLDGHFQSALASGSCPNNNGDSCNSKTDADGNTTVTIKTTGEPVQQQTKEGATITMTPGAVTTKTYDAKGNFVGGDIQSVVDFTVTKNGETIASGNNVQLGQATNLVSDPNPTLQNRLAGDVVRAATGTVAAFMDPHGSLVHNGGEVIAKHMDEHGITLGQIAEFNRLPLHILGNILYKAMDAILPPPDRGPGSKCGGNYCGW
jgi:RHS repeat-associated protein